MEMFIFRHSEWSRIYNCTGIDVDSISFEQRHQFVPESWVLILLCTIYYFLYIPCILSIWKHLDENVCYKLLFYIGIFDLAILWILGYVHAWFSLNGNVFCSSPIFNLFLGFCVTAFWNAESVADLVNFFTQYYYKNEEFAKIGSSQFLNYSITTLADETVWPMVILAFNRCLEILSPNIAELLFSGFRIHIWLSFCTIYAICRIIFWAPALFSSIIFAWSFNPFTGYVPDLNEQFFVPLHIFHNAIIAFLSPLFYGLFIIGMCIKTRSFGLGGQAISRPQKMAFLQVFLISTINVIGASIYVAIAYMYILPPQWLITLAQFAWFHVHGFPPVIYLALNKTIRHDCRLIFYKIFLPNKIHHLHGVTVMVVQQQQNVPNGNILRNADNK